MTITLASTTCVCYANWVSFRQSKGERAVCGDFASPIQDCSGGTQCDALDGTGSRMVTRPEIVVRCSVVEEMMIRRTSHDRGNTEA
jgi:hypothetical protein